MWKFDRPTEPGLYYFIGYIPEVEERAIPKNIHLIEVWIKLGVPRTSSDRISYTRYNRGECFNANETDGIGLEVSDPDWRENLRFAYDELCQYLSNKYFKEVDNVDE